MLTKMITNISEGIKFTFDNPRKVVWKKFNSRDNTLGLYQFIKYAISGGGAGIIQVVTTYYISVWFFPTFGEEGLKLTDTERGNNQIISNFIAFPFGHLFAYIVNVLWVFTTGKHSRIKEFTIFTLIALFSFSVGVFAGPFLVKVYGINSTLAQGSLVITSALVNFISRKYIIFKN